MLLLLLLLLVSSAGAPAMSLPHTSVSTVFGDEKRQNKQIVVSPFSDFIPLLCFDPTNTC